MKNKIFYILITTGFLISASSCEKYLEVLPDNRAELNNNEKIAKLLVSAYPENAYVMAAEISSDNVDNMGPTYANYTRFIQELFEWEESTEPNNDGINNIWTACYGAIASANAALQAIEEDGNPSSLAGEKGEALLARAYNHWILVNMFAQNYSKTHSSSDLGVTYMTKGETTLNPKYERNTVSEVYEFMIKDIEEGLPLIRDDIYANSNVAKYHFNRAAAYTFASRVALFMEDWPKVIQYSNLALGESPTTTLRDYTTISTFSAAINNTTREYNASTIKANFLIGTAYSAMGTTFGGYSTNNRIAHGGSIAKWETVFAPQVYGTTASSTAYRIRVFGYASSTTNKVILPHVAYMFEVRDAVAGTGYSRGVYAPLTSEEALLNRAEANVHLKNYAPALSDINIHVLNNTIVNPATVTEASVNAWANNLAYFTPTAPTPKKKLNPEFTYESGLQENMLHAILSLKRIQFLHTGMRWFDVKRYGIEITRRETPSLFNANVASFTYIVSDNTLKVRDNRRALQLPQDVISAGLTPNPR